MQDVHLKTFLKRSTKQKSACIRKWFSVLDFQYKGKHFKRKHFFFYYFYFFFFWGGGGKIMFNQKSQISGIFKKSVLDFKETAY